ncbi:hypothetical protein PIB30_061772 [Stylosanthes scabra]|uniref:Uncharacterized protein n=1 Tax=Stylosanthes scabra TaxID=79078 RepID=A0ABU6YJT2_9FABA|nr:hypothetical protein [Stylosanthes scabra]
MEWTARNGAPAPFDVNFVIKQGWRAAARSTQILIWTIIYRCEALDVSFPMALEPSHLDLCSSSYENCLEPKEVFNMKVVEIEFIFPKSPILIQSDDYNSVSPLRILPSL